MGYESAQRDPFQGPLSARFHFAEGEWWFQGSRQPPVVDGKVPRPGDSWRPPGQRDEEDRAATTRPTSTSRSTTLILTGTRNTYLRFVPCWDSSLHPAFGTTTSIRVRRGHWTTFVPSALLRTRRKTRNWTPKDKRPPSTAVGTPFRSLATRQGHSLAWSGLALS
jgi:hypothetical protein